MNPAEAKKQLEQWTTSTDDEDDDEGQARFQSAVEKLPKRLRDVGYALLGLDRGGKPGWEDYGKKQRFHREQERILDRLSRTDRLKLFRIFFGKLADAVELTWHWLKSAPMSNHNPFRTPGAPELSLLRRVAWVRSLLPLGGQIDHSVLTPAWLAAWVPYIEAGWRSFEVSAADLFAAVIDKAGKQGDAVFEVLCESAHKEHEIGAMGRHVTDALLSAARPDGWELMEKMLLAAQRQEGLRQVILTSAVYGHQESFRRILRVMLEHSLSRFSSVALSVHHWLGVTPPGKLDDALALLADLLDDPQARKAALTDDAPDRAYLALWATAFVDAQASVKPAARLLKHPSPEMRFIAVMHLARLGLPAAAEARLPALGDEDLRVAICALSGVGMGDYYDEDYDDYEEDEREEPMAGPALFEACEKLLHRVPAKPTALKPYRWPQFELVASREVVGDQLISALGKLSPTRLIPHFKLLTPCHRSSVVDLLARQKKWSAQTRRAIIDLAGDKSSDVRENALKALQQAGITAADAPLLEAYLTRTTADLRNGVVVLLLMLPDAVALASSRRLLDGNKKQLRLAGLEMLRHLSEADRGRAECIATATTWFDGRKKILEAEQSQMDAILASERGVLSLDDALGLMDPAARSKTVAPVKRQVQCTNVTVPKLLKSLDDLVHSMRQEVVTFSNYDDARKTATLGEIGWEFPSPNRREPKQVQLKRLPLREAWEAWYAERPQATRDRDGLELLRAYVSVRSIDWERDELKRWAKGTKERAKIQTLLFGTQKPLKLKYDSIVETLVEWLLLIHPPKGAADFALDGFETLCALMPKKDLDALCELDDEDDADCRSLGVVSTWRCLADWLAQSKPQRKRFWQLLHWLDEPVPGARRNHPDLNQLTQAYMAGHANLIDITDQLLCSPAKRYWGVSFDSLECVTERNPARELRLFLKRPEVAELLDRIKAHLLEIELARGEAATPGSEAALSVRSYRGMDILLTLLRALGKDGLKVLSGWRAQVSDSRAATLTDLVRRTYPSETDTPQQFVKAVRQAINAGEFSEDCLVRLAFLAPQWTDFVQAAMWDGFTEALYWYMAHMNDMWGVDEAFEGDADLDAEQEQDSQDAPRKLTRWQRIILERTHLTDEERSDGAIDVGWFQRMYAGLSHARWEAVAKAARFAASAARAKRASYIGEVLLGKARKKDLVDGIRQRNLKENVRLLGLLPLARGKQREADILDRYEVLQEYRRYANKLSAMSRPDAERACDIGMRNLAATAGYADPLRLQWALEAKSTADLAAGPVVVRKGDVSLTLALDFLAAPELTIRRGEKVLKSLPAAVRKDKQFVELRERNKQLKRQASRVKGALEQAMCRGDSFSGAELMALADHALLWPQLERLVLIGDGIVGYPCKRGKALRDQAGKLEPVRKTEQLRIAHPHDLLATKNWARWQKECFVAERLQPFKQIFRELYVVTRQEKKDRTFSNRYAAQQVNPRQAHALWGRRGWAVDEYENVWKAFPDEGFNVSVSFEYGETTPLEFEGLTIDQVRFQRRDEYKPMKLADVPPRLFSETMRDLDLVVSVAHVGEVDPEATASTVEMRASLLRETLQLLKLKNVKLKESRALIKGALGEYTVHLGSGVVHLVPGGSVCIVPVHSQHRGRLFLPFADDDPRTAEVVSKTLLLARDDQIDDPIILEQLHR